ncbi:hypothetical protein [Methylobacterium sp. Gmos1]
MTPLDKINDLFIALTERYGAFELKPGQQLDRIADSWCASVGAYSMKDINLALATWVRTSKFARWPEEGQMLELLRQCGCEPERDDTTPAEWKEAETNGGVWYAHTLLKAPMPDGWTRLDVSACIDAMLQRFHYKTAKSNAHSRLLARAWKAGAMQPAAWDLHCARWYAEHREKLRKHQEEVQRVGVRRAYEHLASRRAA